MFKSLLTSMFLALALTLTASASFASDGSSIHSPHPQDSMISPWNK